MGKRKTDAGEPTMAMWCMMVGTIVDTMVEGDVDCALIHSFLDRLHSSTDRMLRGDTRHLIHEMLEVVRMVVPAND